MSYFYDCAFSLASSSMKSTIKAIFTIWELPERAEVVKYFQKDAHDVWYPEKLHTHFINILMIYAAQYKSFSHPVEHMYL